MFHTLHAKRVLVRHGFSDYDTYGSGTCCAATGTIDAPDYIPQGSVRKHDTTVPCHAQSIGHRDQQDRPMGDPHDGPWMAICS